MTFYVVSDIEDRKGSLASTQNLGFVESRPARLPRPGW